MSQQPTKKKSLQDKGKKNVVGISLKPYNITPSGFLDYRDFLQAFYQSVKADITDYTYLRFAYDLGFSLTGVIHQVIKGRRPLTAKAGKKICEAIGLRGYERQYLELLITYCNAHDAGEKAGAFKLLIEIRSKIDPVLVTPDQLEFVSEWFHPVIKELISLPQVSQDPMILAKLLNPPIRPLQVKNSLELLTRLGFLKFDETTNRYSAHADQFKTPRTAEGLLVARYHQGMLDLARAAVSEVDHENRDITSTTLRASAPLIALIKEQIYQFHMNALAQEEDPQTTDEIYQLSVQLFPLTKLKSPKDG